MTSQPNHPTNSVVSDPSIPALRTCPFCGSDAYLSNHTMSGLVFVLCHGCAAMNGPHTTPLKASVQWNKRAVGVVPADPVDIEDLFDRACDSEGEAHVVFARLLEKHRGIGGD
jgi:hypothetical protein